MRNQRRAIAMILAGTCAFAATSAQAAIIMGAGSLPGSNPIHLRASNLVGPGPVIFDGATWSSNVAASMFGWTGGYAFGNHTVAPGHPPIIAVGAGHDAGGYASMTLAFPALTNGFLGEFFWTDFTSAGNSVNVAAYAADDTLLEFQLLNDNGRPTGNPPGFYGFSRGQADIAYVKISNGFVGARNLRWMGREINSPGLGGIPEPASWALLIVGFGAIGSRLRRRRPRIVLTLM